jgi:uncharacterized membrane protein
MKSAGLATLTFANRSGDDTGDSIAAFGGKVMIHSFFTKSNVHDLPLRSFQKIFFVLYVLIVVVLSSIMVLFLSVFAAMQGVDVPWIQEEAGKYTIKNALVLIPGTIVGLLFVLLSHRLVVTTGRRGYYFLAIWPIIVVIPLAILMLYGEACGYCRAVVCTPNPVQSCGITARFSLTLFEVMCNCYR